MIDKQKFITVQARDYEIFNSTDHNVVEGKKIKLYKLLTDPSYSFVEIDAFLKENIITRLPKDLKHLGLLDTLEEAPPTSDATGTIWQKESLHLMRPFKPLPNVKSFEITLKPFDLLCALFGVKKRFKPDLSFTKCHNNGMNRYLLWQCKRLVKYRGSNPLAFWRCAKFLMTHSKVFQIYQLRCTSPNWHRNLPYWYVIRTLKRVRFLCRTNSTDLDFRRVFIPKSEFSVRPLGVPTLEWRIYLGLWNKFLQMYCLNLIPSSQHAYLPGKGTLTCWKEIINKAIKSRNIIEADLRSFFPNVYLPDVYREMESQGFPLFVIEFFELLNRNLPKGLFIWDNPFGLTKQDMLNSENLKPWVIATGSSWTDRWKPIEVEETEDDPYGELSTRDTSIHFGKNYDVAQGVPPAPLLSILVLKKSIFSLFNKVIMYADDLIIYGSRRFNAKQKAFLKGEIALYGNVRAGIGKKAASFVKKDGKWLKPLKFLGLETDGINIWANTRNGSELVFDKWELLEFLRKRDGNEESWRTSDKPSLIDLARNAMFGLVQARLYSGKWTEDDLQQDFRMTFVRGSWASFREHLVKRGEMNIFNSSSFALGSLWYILKTTKDVSSWHTSKDVTEERQIVQKSIKEMHYELIDKLYSEQSKYPKELDFRYMSDEQRAANEAEDEDPEILQLELMQAKYGKTPEGLKYLMKGWMEPAEWMKASSLKGLNLQDETKPLSQGVKSRPIYFSFTSHNLSHLGHIPIQYNINWIILACVNISLFIINLDFMLCWLLHLFAYYITFIFWFGIFPIAYWSISFIGWLFF